jgi:hypothetical protein
VTGTRPGTATSIALAIATVAGVTALVATLVPAGVTSRSGLTTEQFGRSTVGAGPVVRVEGAVHTADADAWARVPVGLRAAVSSVIGASQPAWRVVRRGGWLVAAGGGVRGSFDRGGVSLSEGSGSARLVLAGVGCGRRLMAVMSAAPVAWRNSGTRFQIKP